MRAVVEQLKAQAAVEAQAQSINDSGALHGDNCLPLCWGSWVYCDSLKKAIFETTPAFGLHLGPT